MLCRRQVVIVAAAARIRRLITPPRDQPAALIA
jgi:hypothetical protein